MSSGYEHQAITAGDCLVLVPGLLSGTRGSKACESLCRLLGFAEQIELAEDQCAESLVTPHLLPSSISNCAAHVTYLKDFPQPPGSELQLGKVMRADPAYQQIDMNNATLGNPLELDLTRDECVSLQHTLNKHFADDGIHFKSADPQRWYCHFKVMPDVVSTPVSAAIGRDVASCRPRSLADAVDARQWRSKLAEIEMLLFEHPVNLARQQNNKLPVNTLWLWGEGTAVESTSVKNYQVYSDHFYTQSVCEFGGIESMDLPLSAADFQVTGSPLLIVIDKFTHPVALQDSQALNWFDEVICDQLWRNLNASGLQQITLWCGDNRLFKVHASVKKQWLRRLFYKPRTLSDFIPDNPHAEPPSGVDSVR